MNKNLTELNLKLVADTQVLKIENLNSFSYASLEFVQFSISKTSADVLAAKQARVKVCFAFFMPEVYRSFVEFFIIDRSCDKECR